MSDETVVVGPVIVQAIINMLSSKSFKPYLLRAFHEYASENSDTPHIIVDAKCPGVDVPAGWADDKGQIRLNISWTATHQLFMGADEVKFRANFGQNQIQCVIPMESILVAYGRESGFQIPFIRLVEKQDGVANAIAPEEKPLTFPNKPIYPPDLKPKNKDRSHLTVIK